MAGCMEGFYGWLNGRILRAVHDFGVQEMSRGWGRGVLRIRRGVSRIRRGGSGIRRGISRIRWGVSRIRRVH